MKWVMLVVKLRWLGQGWRRGQRRNLWKVDHEVDLLQPDGGDDLFGQLLRVAALQGEGQVQHSVLDVLLQRVEVPPDRILVKVDVHVDLEVLGPHEVLHLRPAEHGLVLEAPQEGLLRPAERSRRAPIVQVRHGRDHLQPVPRRRLVRLRRVRAEPLQEVQGVREEPARLDLFLGNEALPQGVHGHHNDSRPVVPFLPPEELRRVVRRLPVHHQQRWNRAVLGNGLRRGQLEPLRNVAHLGVALEKIDGLESVQRGNG
mmetsp:Transcript_25236/g.54139  ORF Transcript_25236/g.54139 Transcript_25236/m.54139 type:complete len:258 (-) Transcript_25236:1040-1813(-)